MIQIAGRSVQHQPQKFTPTTFRDPSFGARDASETRYGWRRHYIHKARPARFRHSRDTKTPGTRGGSFNILAAENRNNTIARLCPSGMLLLALVQSGTAEFFFWVKYHYLGCRSCRFWYWWPSLCISLIVGKVSVGNPNFDGIISCFSWSFAPHFTVSHGSRQRTRQIYSISNRDS
jgi:hypothetical protein